MRRRACGGIFPASAYNGAMWLRIWAVMQKEFVQTLRDRRTLLILLSIPIIELFLFAYAIRMNVDHLRTVVAGAESAESYAYVQALEASSYFDVIAYVDDQAAVIRAIDGGRAQVGVVFPPDFARDLQRGTAQVLILVDGSDFFPAQTAYGMAGVTAQQYGFEVLMQRLERAGYDTRLLHPPLDVRVRILYNPDMSDLVFLLPGLLAMLLQTQTLALTSAAIVREREMGTMEALLVTPIRPLELMLGKIVPNVLIVVLDMLFILVMGTVVFRVPFRGNLLFFFAVSALYLLSGLGLGILVSSVSRSQKQSQQIIMVVMLLGVILSGFIFPRYAMPRLIQWVGLLFPLTYFLGIARGVINKGVGWSVLRPEVLSIALYVVIVLTAAVVSFRRRLE